ncbi:hemopexin domain protein [Ceratobasidium sp. AG-Ba]|nr:hemopexin domain protein [Ceratobasidium sp. AG-Ba]
MVGRAAVNFIHGDKTTTYFFKDGEYVRVQWTPGSNDDRVTFGPAKITDHWKALSDAGFGRVDAILPIAGKENRAYFFCGGEYARIQYTPGDGPEGQILGGVRSLNNWRSLATAGWDCVDAAILVPGTMDQAYFFSRNEFCRVSFKEGSGSADELLEGPYLIQQRWSNLGFQTIDTIIPSPSSPNQAYVFSGGFAARIELVVGGGVDVKAGPMSAAEYWQSLGEVGFYSTGHARPRARSGCWWPIRWLFGIFIVIWVLLKTRALKLRKAWHTRELSPESRPLLG